MDVFGCGRIFGNLTIFLVKGTVLNGLWTYVIVVFVFPGSDLALAIRICMCVMFRSLLGSCGVSVAADSLDLHRSHVRAPNLSLVWTAA